MNRSLFMTIAAILALLFGLGFILAPAQVVALYAMTTDPSGLWLARYLGSAFLGIGVIVWQARNAQQSEALRAVILGGVVSAITGLIVAVLNKMSGVGNNFVWITVIIYGFLTVGYGYFQFVKPQE